MKLCLLLLGVIITLLLGCVCAYYHHYKYIYNSLPKRITRWYEPPAVSFPNVNQRRCSISGCSIIIDWNSPVCCK